MALKILLKVSNVCNKLLKNINGKSETEYKNYKTLFEAIKKRSKKNHFSKLYSPLKTIQIKTQLAKVNVTIRIFLKRLLLIIWLS